MRGERIQIPQYAGQLGPQAKRHLNGGFRWRADDDPTLKAGLVALCFFSGSDKYCYETLVVMVGTPGARLPTITTSP